METYDLSSIEAYSVMQSGYTVEDEDFYHYCKNEDDDGSIDEIYKYRKSSGELLSMIEFKMLDNNFKVIESEDRRFID